MVLILHEALYMPSSSTNHIYQLDCRATNMVLVLTETWQFLGNFSPSFETHFLTCMCVMLSRVGDLIWSICFLRPKGKHCSDTLARVNWIITSSQASQMCMTVLFCRNYPRTPLKDNFSQYHCPHCHHWNCYYEFMIQVAVSPTLYTTTDAAKQRFSPR